MDKCQMHVVKWKKSDPHICTLYRSIYITFWERWNYRDKINEWLPVVVGVGDNESKKIKNKQQRQKYKSKNSYIEPGLILFQSSCSLSNDPMMDGIFQAN